jgi:hypothetical protein
LFLQSLKVIGAGFPRSGTKSTKKALEELGYKVFHMEDFMSNNLQDDATLAMTSDYFLDKFTNKLLALGFNATIDSPGFFFALRWAKKFPNAKVFLGVRDSSEEHDKSFHTLMHAFRTMWARPFVFATPKVPWWEIGLEQLGIKYEITFCSSWIPWYDCVEKYTYDRIGGGTLAQAMDEWTVRVKRELSADRLLVFNVKQGWAPLCKFLGVKQPTSTFPHINESESLKIIFLVMQFIACTWIFFAFFGLWIVHRVFTWLKI